MPFQRWHLSLLELELSPEGFFLLQMLILKNFCNFDLMKFQIRSILETPILYHLNL